MTADISPADDIAAVTASLLAERNLSGRASIMQVARAIAKALIDATPSSIAAAAQLLATLPGIVPVGQREPELPYHDLDHAEDERDWDLSRLTTVMLDQLELIAAVACGVRRRW